MSGLLLLLALGAIAVMAFGHRFGLQPGLPFPHRSTIQFLAYFVVIGTLLIQGPTLPLLARRLRIDTTAEDAAAARDLATAREIADGAAGDGYDKQRDAVTAAVIERLVDDEAARRVLADVDRQQAAADSRARTWGARTDEPAG